MGLSNKTGNVLLLSSGSKAAIAKLACKAARKHGASVFACDTTDDIPSAEFVDAFKALPHKNKDAYLEKALTYCKERDVRLLVPTRHADLETLSRHRNLFEDAGITIALSSSTTLQCSLDKLETYNFFKSAGIPTPHTVNAPESISAPAIAKARYGSGSQGIIKSLNAISISPKT